MAIIKITKDNFEEKVLNADKPVLIDFWASWCGPCQMVSPIIDEIAEETTDVYVGKINVDEENELAVKYMVMSIPTIMVIKNGEPVKTLIGLQSKDAILDMINGL